MDINIDIDDLTFDGSAKRFDLGEARTSFQRPLFKSKQDYQSLLNEFRREIDELQNKMYAHDRYAMLILFQAMDAAGKDGTIQKVMSGVNAARRAGPRFQATQSGRAGA